MASVLPTLRLRFKARRVLQSVLLTISAVFLVLHALHLNADFPNHSPWMDWSKYTDEGWYGDAAIRHFQRGHWYVPGDFNPAAALPVWPLLEAIVFHFTGVSAAAARTLTVAVFGFILLAVYLLLRRWTGGIRGPQASASQSAQGMAGSLVPSIAVLLLAVSPFCYVFTRMAILEPMLILLTLLALLAASYLPQAGAARLTDKRTTRLPAISLGLLVPLMVLTKTTAIFLLPSIAWLVWVRAGSRAGSFLRLSLLPAVIAGGTWLTYYLALVRPRFLLDYQYLFSANAYTKITYANALSVFATTVEDGLWMGRLIYPLAVIAIFFAVLRPRDTRRNPLIVALTLWVSGYMAFLAYHNNLQPRYYLVIAVPLTMLVPLVFEGLWQRPGVPLATGKPSSSYHVAGMAVLAALAVTALLDGVQTIHYVRHPEYTFIHAAAEIREIVAGDQQKDPGHNPLLLSISGSNLSLMTGLPSICDDFGTMDLAVRVKAYKPGWFLTWNQVDDDKMDALTPLYSLRRVAAFPVMDDPDRNLLILYRLDPADSSSPRLHRRKQTPRSLQTKLGQQPTTIQLEH